MERPWVKRGSGPNWRRYAFRAKERLELKVFASKTEVMAFMSMYTLWTRLFGGVEEGGGINSGLTIDLPGLLPSSPSEELVNGRGIGPYNG